MLTNKMLALLAVTAIFPMISAAQWIPVHATETKVTSVIDPTGKSHVSIKQGPYDRNSAGEVVEQLSELGSTSHETQLFSKEGTFILDSTKRIAMQMTMEVPSPAPAPAGTTPPNLIGQDTVDGISCTLFPVVQIINSKEQQIGKSCIDLADSLELREDFTIPAGQAGTHVVRSLSNITKGQEPNPGLFRIPDGYTVSP